MASNTALVAAMRRKQLQKPMEPSPGKPKPDDGGILTGANPLFTKPDIQNTDPPEPVIGALPPVPVASDRAPLDRLLRMQDWRGRHAATNAATPTWHTGGLGTTINYDPNIYGSNYQGPTGEGAAVWATAPWRGPGADPRRPASAGAAPGLGNPLAAGTLPGTAGTSTALAPPGTGVAPGAGQLPGTAGTTGVVLKPNQTEPNKTGATAQTDRNNVGRAGASSVTPPVERDKSAAANAIAGVMRTSGRTKPIGAMMLPGGR